jgi:ADP-ribose pyrophosphatase
MATQKKSPAPHAPANKSPRRKPAVSADIQAGPKVRKVQAEARSSSPARKPVKRLTGKARVLSSKISYKGKVFDVSTDKVTEPGGVTSIRDVIRHSGSVVILAVDASRNPADPTILIERQYRHAAGRFLLELPAGRIEPGEPALAAAKRELIEETGFRARTWSRLVRYYASPGFLAEHMQVFLAEDIRPGIAQPEADELIELLHIPLSELLAMIHAGKIEDAKTLLSVLLYASRTARRPSIK